MKAKARYDGSKLLAIESQPVGKQDLLKSLLLVKAEFQPEPRSVRQEMLGESQRSFDIELVSSRGAQLHLCEGELLTQLIALPLVGLPVD